MPSERASNFYAPCDQGRTSSNSDICIKSSCNNRPDTGEPCLIHKKRISKETSICYKCEVRTGGNPHLTSDQVAELYEQAMELIKHMENEFQRWQDEDTKKITEKHHKCSMPWCNRMTTSVYCRACLVLVGKRRLLGWAPERLHDPKRVFVRQKCSMPWCENLTAGVYCEKCYQTILSRQRHGWPESRWYEKPRRYRRAAEQNAID